MSKVVLLIFVAIDLFLSASGECAGYFNMELFNNTLNSVVVVIHEREAASIKAGKTKAFPYFREWHLVISGQSFFFEPIVPIDPSIVPLPRPPWLITHFFGSSFRAQLNSDHKIYLLPKDARPPVTVMPAQPEGFPIVLRQRMKSPLK